MGNRAPDAIAALRAYAREIEADVERSVRAPQPLSHPDGATMPSARFGARFIAPLVFVSAIVVGLAGTAVVVRGNQAAAPPAAGPVATTADSAPAISGSTTPALAERAVLRLRSTGLISAADSIESAVDQGIIDRPDIHAAIQSLLAVLDERDSAGVAELSNDPVVLAAADMVITVIRPPGLDPSFIPPGQGGTPPGQDPDFTPPGQDPDFTPPGQDPDFTPPGQNENTTPPGQGRESDR